MGKIFDAMVKFFKEDKWQYTELEAGATLRMGVSGKNGKWTCFARAREQQEQFVFYSVCSVNAPEDKRSDIAECLTRANYGLVIGNFELDYGDGEIRYKSSIDVENDRLTSPLIKNLVYANVAMMDKYLPGIMAVLYGGASPTKAIAQIEG